MNETRNGNGNGKETTMKCSACNGRLVATEKRLYSCASCDGLHGTCYLGEFYSIVGTKFHSGPEPDQSEWRYYDLTCLGSKGVERFHGWYHPKTRTILQTG